MSKSGVRSTFFVVEWFIQEWFGFYSLLTFHKSTGMVRNH